MAKNVSCVNQYFGEESRLDMVHVKFIMDTIDNVVEFDGDTGNWVECSSQMYYFLTGKGQ